ncbi:hypothetical protein KEM54_000484, partial [Ascosphaera aggregata]
MIEDDEISPAPPLPTSAEGRPPSSRRSQGPTTPPHSDSLGLNRKRTDDSAVRDGKAGKSGKSGH